MGPSSGAAIHAAIELAKTDEAAGKTIVVLQASSGIRYVNHPMWDPEREEAALALPSKPASAEEPWRQDYRDSLVADIGWGVGLGALGAGLVVTLGPKKDPDVVVRPELGGLSVRGRW